MELERFDPLGDQPLPPPRKKKQRKHQEIPHIDEKWLVSYSDMMTLLFGLFVMLYSIAMEKQGSMNAELQKVSQAMKNEAVSVSEAPPPVPVAEAAAVGSGQSEPAPPPSPESIPASDSESSRIAELQQQVLAKDTELATNSETLRKMQEAVQDLMRQKDLMAKDIQTLEKRLNVNPSKSAPVRGSILLMVKWENEKHDVDMEVKAPSGAVFNFKNRSSSADKGAFVSDASKGPGTEVFRSSDEASGLYEVSVTLYNTRGDTTPSKVQLVAVTPRGEEKEIQSFTLTKENKTKKISLEKRDFLK